RERHGAPRRDRQRVRLRPPHPHPRPEHRVTREAALSARPGRARARRREPRARSRKRGGDLLMRLLTNLVGAVDEAWAELRIHRTRVLLSLIGVSVAVAALTGIVALGQMAQQATTESYERQSGRPATLIASAYSMTNEPLESPAVRAAFDTVIDRYSITYAGAVTHTSTTVQFVGGTQFVSATPVEPDYATTHRLILADGRWFTERDNACLAPVSVVNPHFYDRLGSPDLATRPAVSRLGDEETVAVIVGVVPASEYDDLSFFM